MKRSNQRSETQVFVIVRAVIHRRSRCRLDVHVAEVPASRRLLEVFIASSAVEVALVQDAEADHHLRLRAHRRPRVRRRGRLPAVAARLKASLDCKLRL